MSRFGRIRLVILAVVAIAVAAPVVAYGRDVGPRRQEHPLTALTAIGTAFNFQGRLSDGGSPANGIYGFVFYLYDAPAGGSQVGPAVTMNSVPVSAGLFTVPLDFGNVFHGAQYYLEIQVRPGASVGSYTVLSPREAISTVPDASFAVEAGTADALQGIGVSTTPPASGNVLTFNGTSWAPAAPRGGGGSLTLPFTNAPGQSSGSTLFSVFNTNASGSGSAAIVGETSSTAGSVPAVVGRVNTPSAGSFSTGVWGINEGTSVFGVGVTGYQAGSGWGVYGSTASGGRGVYGVSPSGVGVHGSSSTGTGGSFTSGSGPAIDIAGPIKVSGSSPAAFAFTVTAASKAAAGCTWCAAIDNPYALTDPTAIVMVTQYYGSTAILNNHSVGVFWTGSQWAVFNEDQMANSMVVGTKFNVLVIKQ